MKIKSSEGICITYYKDHGWVPMLETTAGTELWRGPRAAKKKEARAIAEAQLEKVAEWLRSGRSNGAVGFKLAERQVEIEEIEEESNG